MPLSFKLNPFVFLERIGSVRDFPEEHIIVYPGKEPFLNHFKKIETNRKGFPYFGGASFTDSCGFELPKEARAVRCLRGNEYGITVLIPYLSHELHFPATDQPQYVFDSVDRNAFPLPQELTGQVVIRTDFKNQPRIEIQFNERFEVFSHYTYEKDITNRFDIWVHGRGVKNKPPLNIFSLSFDKSSHQYLPEATEKNGMERSAIKEYKLTANPANNYNGIVLGHTLLNQEVTLRKSALQFSSTPTQASIAGYFDEFYKIEGEVSSGPLQNLHDCTYEQLTLKIGIDKDEHHILGPQKLFSQENFISKTPGMALGIIPRGWQEKLKRISDNQLIYTDADFTLLWGNLILEAGKS